MIKQIIALLLIFFLAIDVHAQDTNGILIGMSKIDITPDPGIRLAGYRQRNKPYDIVDQRLWAKALTVKNEESFSIFITVDLLGIPKTIVEEVRDSLDLLYHTGKVNLSVSASHTHSGPMIGNIIAETDNPLRIDELLQMALYSDGLIDKLIKVSIESIDRIDSGYIYSGSGNVDFAVNREPGNFQYDSVDHQLSVLRIVDANDSLKGLVLNYACHAVTFGPENNNVHGDWVGETEKLLEEKYDEIIAMVSVGCGGDQNSHPRDSDIPNDNYKYVYSQAKQIEEEVDRMFNYAEWKLLSEPPSVEIKNVELKFKTKPDPDLLADAIKNGNESTAYEELILSRMARSEDIPMKFDYEIQVWNFGQDLHMIFLPGEVVSDYGLRFKELLGKENVWVNAYSNDMPGYIASRRLINSHGYAAIWSMKGYEKPLSTLTLNVEEQIVQSVLSLLPQNKQQNLFHVPGSDGKIILPAQRAKASGEHIKFMPEWNAFGWFRSEDKVEWKINALQSGVYEVWLNWSVSDEESGKSFLLEIGNNRLIGKIPSSGGWENFKTALVGEIEINQGRQNVVFSAADSFSDEHALLDFREIILVPKL